MLKVKDGMHNALLIRKHYVKLSNKQYTFKQLGDFENKWE